MFAALLAVSARARRPSGQPVVEPRSAVSGRTGALKQGRDGGVLGPTSAVPVGGGRVYAARKVVVTQPTAGTFRGFSAICTHRGCTVNSVSGGTINCPCHGSKFHIADGTVAHGPARRPLPSRPVSAEGGQVRLR